MMKSSNQTYITSDLHFFHGNIVRYCSRPYDVKNNDIDANHDEIMRMNEDILKMFDSLPENCEIWNLGDVFFNGRGRSKKFIERYYADMKRYVARMSNNGTRRLYLVLGNHDDLHFEGETVMQFYYSLGFDKVYDTPVIIDNSKILSHEPVYIPKSDNVFSNYHGHTHNLCIEDDYFVYDYDNYAMIKRCCDIEGVKPPFDLKPLHIERLIDASKYHNVCLDYLKKIIIMH